MVRIYKGDIDLLKGKWPRVRLVVTQKTPHAPLDAETKSEKGKRPRPWLRQ